MCANSQSIARAHFDAGSIKDAAGDVGTVIKDTAKGAAEGAREGAAKVEAESDHEKATEAKH